MPLDPMEDRYGFGSSGKQVALSKSVIDEIVFRSLLAEYFDNRISLQTAGSAEDAKDLEVIPKLGSKVFSSRSERQNKAPGGARRAKPWVGLSQLEKMTGSLVSKVLKEAYDE